MTEPRFALRTPSTFKAYAKTFDQKKDQQENPQNYGWTSEQYKNLTKEQKLKMLISGDKRFIPASGAIEKDVTPEMIAGAFLLPATPLVRGIGKVGNFAVDAMNPLAGVRKLNTKMFTEESGIVKKTANKISFTSIPIDSRVSKILNDEIDIQLSPENLRRAAALDEEFGTNYVKQLNILEGNRKIKTMVGSSMPHNVVVDNMKEGAKGQSGLSLGAQFSNMGRKIDLSPEGFPYNVSHFEIRLPHNHSEYSDHDLRILLSHELRHNIELNGHGLTSGFNDETKKMFIPYDQIYRTNKDYGTINDLDAFHKDYKYRTKPTEVSAYIGTGFRRDMLQRRIINRIDDEILPGHVAAYNMHVEQYPSSDQVASITPKMFNYTKNHSSVANFMNKSLLTTVPVGAVALQSKSKK